MGTFSILRSFTRFLAIVFIYTCACRFAHAELTSSSIASPNTAATTACEPNNTDSVAWQCARGLLHSVIDLIHLPGNLLNAVALGQRNLAECNSNPEIKRGLLTVIEPMINLDAWLSRSCENIIENLARQEHLFLTEVSRKKNRLAEIQTLQDGATNDPVRTELFTQMREQAALTAAEQAFSQRWLAREQFVDRLSGADVARGWSCTTYREMIVSTCETIVSAAAGYGAVRALSAAGRAVAGRPALATSGSPPPAAAVSASAELPSPTGIPLSSANRAQLAANYSPEDLQRLGRAINNLNNGVPLSLDEAARTAEILNSVGLRGAVGFHRTQDHAIPAIQRSGDVRPGMYIDRVFALPVYRPGGNGIATTGKAVGNAVVTFQGQAARLFGERPVRSGGDLLVRHQQHQVAPRGRIIIESSERLPDGSLVITRARIEPLQRNAAQHVMGLTDAAMGQASNAILISIGVADAYLLSGE